MAYAVIDTDCISCGICESFCSVGAIEEDGDEYYVKMIPCESYDSCSDDARECKEVCPMEDAIYFVD